MRSIIAFTDESSPARFICSAISSAPDSNPNIPNPLRPPTIEPSMLIKTILPPLRPSRSNGLLAMTASPITVEARQIPNKNNAMPFFLSSIIALKLAI